jgi:hypothetical protein
MRAPHALPGGRLDAQGDNAIPTRVLSQRQTMEEKAVQRREIQKSERADRYNEEKSQNGGETRRMTPKNPK